MSKIRDAHASGDHVCQVLPYILRSALEAENGSLTASTPPNLPVLRSSHALRLHVTVLTVVTKHPPLHRPIVLTLFHSADHIQSSTGSSKSTPSKLRYRQAESSPAYPSHWNLTV